MIVKDTNPLEKVQKCPETEHIIREYDAVLGKCLLCNYLFDSIENIATKHNVDRRNALEDKYCNWLQDNEEVNNPITA